MKICRNLLSILTVGLIIGFTPFESKAETTEDRATHAKQAWSAINKASVLIDVRSPDEYATGHLDGAINIPHDQIGQRVSELEKWKDSSIVVYCKSGRRAGIAQSVLVQNGFKNITNAGGYADLIAAK